MIVEAREIGKSLIWVIVIVLLACAMIQWGEQEHKVEVIETINGYELIELEDGHQYLRSRGLYENSLSHYVDCPKCKLK